MWQYQCYNCAERNLKKSISQKHGFPGQLSGIPHKSNQNFVYLRKKRGCNVCIGNHNLFTRFISTYFNFCTATIDDARKVSWSKEFRKFQVLTSPFLWPVQCASLWNFLTLYNKHIHISTCSKYCAKIFEQIVVEFRPGWLALECVLCPHRRKLFFANQQNTKSRFLRQVSYHRQNFSACYLIVERF